MYRKVTFIVFLVLSIITFSITFEEYEKQTNYEYTGNFFDGTNILVTHVLENKLYDIIGWDTSDLDNINQIYEGESFFDYSVSKDGLKFTGINKNGMVIVYNSENDLNYIILKKAANVYFHPNGDMIIVKVIKDGKSEFYFVDYKNNEDRLVLKYSENNKPFSSKAKMHIFNDYFIISDYKGQENGNKYDDNYIRYFSDPQNNYLYFKSLSDEYIFDIDEKWVYHHNNFVDAVNTVLINLQDKTFTKIALGNIGSFLSTNIAYIDSKKASRVKKYFALKHQLEEVYTGEYFLYNDRFVLVNPIDIPDQVNVHGYDSKNNKHIYLSQGNILQVDSYDNNPYKQMDTYFNNLELLNIGFDNVIEDIVETMNIAGMEFLAYNEDRFFGDSLNTSYYNKTKLILEEVKTLLNKSETTKFDMNFVYKKIVQYSLLANYTKNYGEAEKAVVFLKNLKTDYPNIVNWNKLFKNLVLIEALTISNKTGTKEAYYHILDQDGFLYNEENELDTYIEEYPEIFTNLLKDKKKLSYFSGIPEDKLSSFENSYKAGEALENKEDIYKFDDFLKNNKKNINDLM
jgi:hypothetical protein